jgi:hypothetical protein
MEELDTDAAYNVWHSTTDAHSNQWAHCCTQRLVEKLRRYFSSVHGTQLPACIPSQDLVEIGQPPGISEQFKVIMIEIKSDRDSCTNDSRVNHDFKNQPFK